MSIIPKIIGETQISVMIENFNSRFLDMLGINSLSYAELSNNGGNAFTLRKRLPITAYKERFIKLEDDFSELASISLLREGSILITDNVYIILKYHLVDDKDTYLKLLELLYKRGSYFKETGVLLQKNLLSDNIGEDIKKYDVTEEDLFNVFDKMDLLNIYSIKRALNIVYKNDNCDKLTILFYEKYAEIYKKQLLTFTKLFYENVYIDTIDKEEYLKDLMPYYAINKQFYINTIKQTGSKEDDLSKIKHINELTIIFKTDIIENKNKELLEELKKYEDIILKYSKSSYFKGNPVVTWYIKEQKRGGI